jgi:hypothetical protein
VNGALMPKWAYEPNPTPLLVTFPHAGQAAGMSPDLLLGLLRATAARCVRI